MAIDFERELARLPEAMQALQDKAVAEAAVRAEQLVRNHLGDRHRRLVAFPNIDGGGGVITTGQKCNLHVPWSLEIESWTLLAGTSGSLVLDLRTCGYDTYPAVASICGGAKPALTAAQKATSSTLTGWTTLVRGGDVLRVVVESASTVTLVTLSLWVRPV